MRNIVRFAAAGAVAAALLLALAAPGFCNSVPANKPGAGDKSPLFTISDLEGNKVVLEDVLKSGKAVLLNFFGLRCSSCVEEIGYLNPLFDKYKDKGIVFLAVNVDGVKADIIKAQLKNMQNSPKFTILPNPEFTIPDMFNLAGAPLSFVIGKDGTVQYRHEDFAAGDEKEIEAQILKAIGSK